MAVAEVVIKQEAAEALDLELRVVELCQQHPEGINMDTIQHDQPNVDVNRRVAAINRLLSSGRIELAKQGDGLIYRLKNTAVVSTMQGAENEEKVVYQIVEQSGTKGIQYRDMRMKSGLNEKQLSKAVRTLESKKLIKPLKMVGQKRKKAYILFNLEPDQSVSGGPWFTDQDFESEFVEVLSQQCFKFLQHKVTTTQSSAGGLQLTDVDPILKRSAAFSSSQDVWEFISKLGLSKVKLTIAHIEMLLDALVYDGKVERTVSAADPGRQVDDGDGPSVVKLYRALRVDLPTAGVMCVPCGVCPVVHQCTPDGAISPATCVYMKEWLEFWNLLEKAYF